MKKCSTQTHFRREVGEVGRPGHIFPFGLNQKFYIYHGEAIKRLYSPEQNNLEADVEVVPQQY